MMIPLSDKEADILLGATLVHWGVPFHTAVKREFTEDQQATVDAASTKLIAWREECQGASVQHASFGRRQPASLGACRVRGPCAFAA